MLRDGWHECGVDFESEAEFVDWACRQPEGQQQALALRNLLRALPAAIVEGGEHAVENADPEREKLLIYIFRNLLRLSVGVATKRLLDRSPLEAEIEISLRLPWSSPWGDIFWASAETKQRLVEDAMFVAKQTCAIYCEYYVSIIANAIEPYFASRQDAHETPMGMLNLPLWHDSGWPEGMSADQIGATTLGTDYRFDFFARWYEGMARGEPLDWRLQERVALIDDGIWLAGIDAVAEEIAKIEALFAVRQALDDLAQERAAARAERDRFGIGGNNPPEEMALPAEVRESQTIVWAAVEDIKEEVEAADSGREPDKGRIERAVEAIKAGLAVCVKWACRKADLAIDTVIKWGIPAAGAGIVATNPEKIQALVQAVEGWVPLLK